MYFLNAQQHCFGKVYVHQARPAFTNMQSKKLQIKTDLCSTLCHKHKCWVEINPINAEKKVAVDLFCNI